MTLAIVDLGYGNIGSIAVAFERLGVTPVLTADAERIADAERVVLPGVGAAGFAMDRIAALDLRQTLVALRQPALGICLGMHLLFERSEEGGTDCLGIMSGAVRALDPAPGKPVPHMGWSALEVSTGDVGLASGNYVYFAHSFAAEPTEAMVAATSYGRTVPAVVRQDNWLAAQFHPERSGEAGARFLKAWLQ